MVLPRDFNLLYLLWLPSMLQAFLSHLSCRMQAVTVHVHISVMQPNVWPCFRTCTKTFHPDLALLCPTLCRSCSLQYNTERNKRESGGGRLAEETMLGLQRGFWVCYPVLCVESAEPSPSLCCSSGLDTSLGWAGSSNVSQQKPGAPLFLGRVRML